MRKVRKKSKSFQIFAIILSVLLILITVIAVAELIILNVLPTNLLIPAILILVLICAIGFICVNFMNRKTSGKIFSSLFVLTLIGALSVGSFYLYRTKSDLPQSFPPASAILRRYPDHSTSIRLRRSDGRNPLPCSRIPPRQRVQ